MLPSDPSESRSRPPQTPGGRTRAGAAYQACAVIIGLAPAALTLIFGHGLPLRNLALSALISALFALFAWLLGGVNRSGALAGFGVAFALYAGMAWQTFVVLLLVFLLTWAATRSGRARKLARGLAETTGGRDAAQVVANVGLAAYAMLVPLGPLAACLAVAVLAEAAADTCSSELGKAYGGKTVLVTNGREVAPGTDGGISVVGILAAVFAAAAVAGAARALGALPPHATARVTIAAVLGSFADSFLGAIFERRGWLNNDGVNLLSTGAAAVFAGLLCLF